MSDGLAGSLFGRMAAARQFGANLARARQARGLTQTQLARSLDVADSYVSRLEGGRSTPSFAMLLRLASALGIPPADLLAGIKPDA